MSGRLPICKAWLVGILILASQAPAPQGLAQQAPIGQAPAQAVADALRRELLGSSFADSSLAQFYQSRGYRPIWVRGRTPAPAAAEIGEMVSRADDDGLSPDDYDPEVLRASLRGARSGRPDALARAELATARALTAYIHDLRRPAPGAELVFTEPGLQPKPSDSGVILSQAAAGASPTQLARMNPLYEGLRDSLRRHRDSAEQARLIRANMDRVRGLPIDLGRRFVLVDVATATLRLYEHGRAVDSMKVVVGKAEQPTPMMAGVIRYAVLRPYWNVPPDLVQNSVAPKVLDQGLSYYERQRFEALSDWSESARVLPPGQIDWSAVAGGRQVLRLRQKPGADNMMGAVKFMFPNALGVYLHDTPQKAVFTETQRLYSSGCVRLEDAARLARWLLGGKVAEQVGQSSGEAEQRIDLPEPTPVYILYLTAAPEASGVRFAPDVYGRDRALLASR